MPKGFHYIQMPIIIKHKPMPSEEELESRVRPLKLCPICNYVLCSCGNCHNSELCNEMCSYGQETTEEE